MFIDPLFVLNVLLAYMIVILNIIKTTQKNKDIIDYISKAEKTVIMIWLLTIVLFMASGVDFLQKYVKMAASVKVPRIFS